ncbi:MAG TPA: alpha/beta fold hydrolase [Anaerolineae bacterium]|nr:alpha/beta fold hydrolase [Anaerolineae bacterium]
MAGVPHPIMCIHGFAGHPQDWWGDGFAGYLVEKGGLDPDLIHTFHYGYDDEGNYNNMGEITHIAQRLTRYETDDPDELNSQLLRLSEKSQARGGPAKVDIVAHSMGGIIARYYLKQHKAGLWDPGTPCPVRKLIELGSPNWGLDILDLLGLVPEGSFLTKLLRFLEKLPVLGGQPATQLRALETALRRIQNRARDEFFATDVPGAWLVTAPPLRQMAADSEFMQELNAPGAMPTEVSYHCLYGDIRVSLAVNWGRLTVYRYTAYLGDLLVPVESASTVPGVDSSSYPFPYQKKLTLWIGKPAAAVSAQAQDLSDYLPPSYHSNLRKNPEVQAKALQVLTT